MVEFAGLTGEERGSAYDVSADGSVVVGWIGRGVADMKDAFRWSHQEGVVLLPSLPEWTDYYKEARAVSADGSVVLGHCDPDSPDYYSYRLFRWTQGEGMVDMGPGAYPCISADGSVVVANDGEQGAFRWTEATGRVYLGALPGAILNAYAEDVSANGSVIVGSITYDPEPISKPFYWTPDEGLGLLFDPPGDIAEPTAISADGSMVVGWSDCYEGMGFVWDAVHGPRSLLRVLADEYGLDTSMFSTLMPHDVSADGRVIVGSGYRADGSGVEAWRAVIPEPSTSTLLITALATLVLLGRSTRNGVSRRSCSIGRSY
ncbi:MAG: hypothetical protein A2V70_01705 [Planctomycetes bacterium RBG_13_63_9]|nr:MAG: hypothetical protein A2V70_01705 [Planctomycetes bacterium RBG_13_63_9]